MSYRVQITDEIRAQIDAQVGYYLGEGAGVSTVLGWVEGLYDRLDQLREHPRLYAVAPWPSKAKGYEVRRLVHGEHVLYYRVHDDTRVVELVSLRHSKQRPWLEDDTNGM